MGLRTNTPHLNVAPVEVHTALGRFRKVEGGDKLERRLRSRDESPPGLHMTWGSDPCNHQSKGPAYNVTATWFQMTYTYAKTGMLP